MEYDIIVKPGGDPNNVKLSYEGIEDLKVTDNGDLQIVLKEGSIIQKKPIIYQDIDGKIVKVDGRFKIQDVIARSASDEAIPSVEIASALPRNDIDAQPTTLDSLQFSYSFEVASYSKDYDLIIDPVLVYSTYLGGSGGDEGHAIAVDTSGNAYITGWTASTNFPTVSPFQGSGYSTAFITKINAEGNSLVYSTYLGGGVISSSSIAVDTFGNAYITGITGCSSLPLISPIQGTCGGWYDAFVTKIDASGTFIVYSTYLGGSGIDNGVDIAVDASGNAYITGWTWSTNFPTTSLSFMGTYGGNLDAFVTKIDTSGSNLAYSTYLGGGGYDWGSGITVDTSGNAYITGATLSSNFPISSPIQGTHARRNENDYDAFVTKINPTGSSLVYSTYLGGSDFDVGSSITVDIYGNAYITGTTWSIDFPTYNAIQGTLRGFGDVFITKIDVLGTNFVYSTYLGGGDAAGGAEGSSSIAVDVYGNVYITGSTLSTEFPTVSPIQGTNAGRYDAFVTKIDASGSSIVYSTYLGGSGDDGGSSIAIDAYGNTYIMGNTDSTNFPLNSPIQAVYGGGYSDTFIVKIGEPTTTEYLNQTTTNINNATYIGSGKQQNALLDKINIAISAINASPPDTTLAILVMNDFYKILCNMKKQGKIDANTYNTLYNDYVNILKSLGQTPKAGC